MNPTWSLERLPDWAQRHFYFKLFDVIENAGGELCFVGGCVRDHMLHKNVKDIDMATTLLPEEVIGVLEAENIRAIPTGLDHGTITTVEGDLKVEITTLRKDVETDGRRAVVEYTTDWGEDAQRRDFTVNTLLMDRQAQIYDPTEQGLEDIKSRTIRFVGDAETRIKEDALRIVRYFRFLSVFEKEPNAETLEIISKNAPLIDTLSSERLTDEFAKCLRNDGFVNQLEFIHKAGVLLLSSDVSSIKIVLSNQFQLQIRYGLYDIYARFASFGAFLDTKKGDIFTFSNKQKTFIENFNAVCETFRSHEELNNSLCKSEAYHHGKDVVLQALLFYFARHTVSPYDTAKITLLEKWDVPTFPLSGKTLLKNGFDEGAELGLVLKETEQWWVDNNFESDADECLKYALALKTN